MFYTNFKKLRSLPKISFTQHQFLKSTLIILLFVGLTGCGANSGLINQFTTYGSNTNVLLKENNYKVIGSVKGTASDFYVFGFGGYKKDLVAKAKQNMLDSAKLEGTSRAVINLSLERHRSRFPLFTTHAITVHGTVIEFLDSDSTDN